MADEPIRGLALPQTPQEWMTAVRRCEREGELFRAYDLARQGLAEFPDDLVLKHRAVLCLASTGARQQAADLFDEFRLWQPLRLSLATPLGLDIAALRPRLLKDAALAASGGERTALLAAAGAAYAGLYREALAAGNLDAYYPGVNGATLHLLAGADDIAAALAREVLGQLSARPAGQKSYYEIASELEAELVLGDLAKARTHADAVRTAIHETAQKDYRGLSSTVRQLRLIIAAKGLEAEWLDELTPPPVVHYVGHIIAAPGDRGRFPADQAVAVQTAITAALEEADARFGYGSLAAGADILFAEALLRRGASLHVVLPFDRDEFIETSVRAAGPDWVRRFGACYEQATTVRFATEDRYLGDDHLFSYCSELGMGLALLHAQHLSTVAKQIVVWDGQAAAGPVGTAIDMEHWRRTGMPQQVIPVGNGYRPPPQPAPPRDGAERRTRAMLFGDVKGFSQLHDDQLPAFITVLLGCCAQVIHRYQAQIQLVNTWGDGLFLVFDDAGAAADCALAMQEAMSTIDRGAHGLPLDMALRIGVHLGPVYAAADPILLRNNFFGAHVSRAARIEPVTPENCVYVTETMAAVLALYNAAAFSCEYVGMTEAAKHYGAMRMFLLNRRSPAARSNARTPHRPPAAVSAR
ncbi:MAG TPA: adenylate/guanylate cyclase domain-containing protein [Stellaceae bacterium]|nr:adenylate/guanylate cyclase domain-containing protein [Stellaceae bacterium]